ncbi:hypothetical protein [Silicibacter phage DSS3phi2]|uniref:Uncharacterized protein n=5 Tax=Aorunvirus V12 TaxID=2846074 RepID=A0A2Z4QFK0_9CAUD|nr:hypothetical protein DSS3P2_gp61 [Silicibacter phage DSS3phi2]YP_009880466.1 hypothetical protein HYP62_gp63 [Ruegeria phage vB_RpoP-V12]AWY09018.1 hypothetical protein vBRpoPV21_60 [Ruegeria phage vB_RpoP-V21]AWY09579.1 hypothetical protein vBRpoPV17_60 [Ruegeria phage vB_RpoP-V17]AXF42183.1 hypothetical protein vBRpoPV14_65 [Ruegeria phage vB_RpoP-V14]ACL81329.1 hypothetical protein [Silicibacter phage DSS3phi2]AWY08850.1 hypothetical protein vBRpoPV12_63 [Ruegeria phage vB_RpoP-V12]
MADPRLQWRQLNVAAPNVSGLLSEMRGGINDAASAAEGILGRYQEGAELKAENELIKRIGGMDQDQLRTAFESGAFSDLNLGQRGIEYLNSAMGARADIRSTNVNSDRTQASIGWGNDANSRANAGEARVATEWGHGQAQDAWLRGNAGGFLEAERNALTGGTAFSAHIDRTESGGGADQYDTLFGHRNRENGVRVSEMTIGQAGEFASPSGQYGQSVNAEIGRVATPMGKFQIVGSTLRGLQEDLALPDDVPFSPAVQEQLGLYLAQQRVLGPRTRESQRAGLRAEWEGFKNVSDAELDVMIDEIRSMPPVNRDTILAAASGSAPQGPARAPQGGPRQYTQTGFGGDAWAAEMAASGLFRPDEVLGRVAPLREAGARGDGLIVDERTQLQNDMLAGITESVVNSPNAISGAEAENMIREMLLESGGFTQAEALAAARRGAEMIGQSEGLSSDLTGGSLDAGITGAIEAAAANTVADATRQFQGQDQYRALNDIGRYAEDPTTNLETDLGLPTDPETRGDYDSNVLRNYINEMADKFNVEPAVMAVAMRDAFIRDPGDDGAWWEGDIDLTRNTIENRFNPEIIEQTIAQLTPERRREFDRARSDISIIESQLEQNAGQQRQILSRLNKLDPNDPNDARTREQLLTRLQQLEQTASTLSRQSPTEGR